MRISGEGVIDEDSVGLFCIQSAESLKGEPGARQRRPALELQHPQSGELTISLGVSGFQAPLTGINSLVCGIAILRLDGFQVQASSFAHRPRGSYQVL